jgi:hypothetical protein
MNLWVDLLGGGVASAATGIFSTMARRWGVMISRFPCTLVGTSTTAIQFCRNLLLSEQNRPRKKQKNTERMHTERSTQREWREKETQRDWEGGVHREMRAREPVELKNSCASLKNKYGEWIFTSSCRSRRGGKSWRNANDEEEKKKLAPNLNCEEEENRASSLQVCGWRKGRRRGERKSNSNAKLGRCSVYIKHALLRRRLSLPGILPLSVSGS